MLAPARWLSSPARIDAIYAALHPIVHWLERLRAFEVKVTQVPLSHLSLAGKYGGETDPVAACAIARSLVEIELLLDALQVFHGLWQLRDACHLSERFAYRRRRQPEEPRTRWHSRRRILQADRFSA
jgi:hypothetical protein